MRVSVCVCGYMWVVAGFGKCDQRFRRPDEKGRTCTLQRLQTHPSAAGLTGRQQVHTIYSLNLISNLSIVSLICFLRIYCD